RIIPTERNPRGGHHHAAAAAAQRKGQHAQRHVATHYHHHFDLETAELHNGKRERERVVCTQREPQWRREKPLPSRLPQKKKKQVRNQQPWHMPQHPTLQSPATGNKEV
ncbi:hypothetical protein DQ04_11301030, partial [Trypanosoma grayi]|uniref:hypothetical protein n=1 Tax=Trypanosoma grayi TaxID=71804 RepID=UPI0004F491B1